MGEKRGSDTGSRLLAVGLVAGLVVYTAILVNRASYAVGGSDSSGYARLARSLLNGEVVLPVRALDGLELPASYAPLFTPLGYTPYVRDGEPTKLMTPYYPVGFPLHLAVGASLLGWKYGPFWVSPIAGALSLLLLFLVGRRLGLSIALAVAGALILAVNPTFLFMATQPMSDVTALTWALVMVWAGLRSRHDDRWSLLAGAAFGMAFLVRPTNILLLAPVVFCLRPRIRTVILFTLGGLPVAAAFFGFNYHAFGHPLQTGYGSINLHALITPAGFGIRLEHYSYWLTMTMSPLLLLGFLASAVNRRVEWRDRAMLIAWFGAFLAFYACYSIYDEWWYTRFLLPAYPAVILGATLVTRDLLGRVPVERRKLRAAAGLTLCVVALGFAIWHDVTHGVLNVGREQAVHAESCLWADARLPARSLVVANEMSGALEFYTRHSILRWDVMRPEHWPAVRARIGESGYQLHALLMDHEVEDAQRRVPGAWTEVGHIRNVGLWSVEPMEKTPPAVVYQSGFSAVEHGEDGASWRWMSDEGVVLLENTGEPMRLRIEGDVPLESLPGPVTFKFVLNGQLLDERLSPEHELLKEFVVTPILQGSQPSSELRIISNQAFVPAEVDPNNSDRRRLAFSLTRLVWRAIPPVTE